MADNLKRISLVIRHDQHDQLHDMGVNISGFVRDLIDDRLSDENVVLSVSDETRALYNKIISNTGASDAVLEKFFKQALKKLLDYKIEEMNSLQKTLEKED